MSNTPQNTNQKTQASDYSNQSKQGANPDQKSQGRGVDQHKENDRNPIQQKDGSKSSGMGNRPGMKAESQSADPRREREEEDRPRAGNK